MTWRIILQLDAETSDWAAWVPELPGCASAGSTQAEAVANMREAIELYLRRDPIALPPGAVVVEVAA
jgi:predicted RNase H-like HicB family nuclease